MASVKKKVSGGYEVRWMTPDRHSRKKTFDLKADALAHKTSVEHSTRSGTYVDTSAGRVTFQHYAETWRAAQVHRSGTASQIETNLRRHVYPRLGPRPIGAIRHSEIQALVKTLDETLAPSTVTLIYRWTASVFKAAVADRIITTSPCGAVKLPNVDRPKVIPLPVETVEALVAAVPDRYRALIILGAGTGMRISEALGLTNDRVDWLRRTVTVDRQLVRDGGAEPVFGPVKDKKNRPRTIPLPAVVIDALAEHVQVYGLAPSGLLFTNTAGQPVRRTTFSDVWQKSAGPLGIPSGNGFHQLRHFYASVLIDAGESVKVVQDRLGHTSATMTLDTYGHIWPADDERTRNAVDAVLGKRLA